MFKKILRFIGLFLFAFFLLGYIIHINMPPKKLDLDTAIMQGVLILGMRSIDVVKAAGEPTLISEEKDDIIAWYYKEMENPIADWELEHVYLVFKNGRLSVIKKGSELQIKAKNDIYQ
jgi:cbb3-type cytochrome oxidase subunit 3